MHLARLRGSVLPDPAQQGSRPMDKWLKAALDYLPQWLDFQFRQSEQPGCVLLNYVTTSETESVPTGVGVVGAVGAGEPVPDAAADASASSSRTELIVRSCASAK